MKDAERRPVCMSLFARIRNALRSQEFVTPHLLAAASLLVEVARADGLLKTSEEAALRAALGSRFALSEAESEALLVRAEALAPEPAGAAGLAENALRAIAPADRPALVAAAYRIAAADGRVDEVEDDLVWRIGRLLELGDGEIGRIRAGVLGEA